MDFPPLQSRRLITALAGQPLGHDIQVFDELSSTSDFVRDLGHQGYPSGVIVFAEHQTHGRGRRSNTWLSEPGSNLLFSILLRPQVALEYWTRLTTLCALSICEAIEETTHLQPQIKWPNDVYLSGKKAAGILAESFTSSTGAFIVLGVGINVNEWQFDPSLEQQATSLRQVSQQLIERERLAIAFVQSLNRNVSYWDQGYSQIIDKVRQRSLLIGQAIRAQVDSQTVIGQVLDIDSQGQLIIQLTNGQRRFLSSAEQVRCI